MSVQPISSLTQPSPATATAAAKKTDIGQTDFLTLLITQLQQQDPMNPQDPSEFTSQLTQFSSLEQLVGMKSSIDNMSQAFADSITGLQMLQLSSNSTQAVAFIGKDVLYTNDKMQIAAGQSPDLKVQASQDLHNAKITLRNAAGEVVKTIDLGNVSKGDHTYSYASLGGLTGLADGQYTLSVDGLDSSNAAATASPLIAGHVQGVFFDGGVIYADIDGNRVPLGDIYSVRDSAAVAA